MGTKTITIRKDVRKISQQVGAVGRVTLACMYPGTGCTRKEWQEGKESGRGITTPVRECVPSWNA